MRGMLGSYVKQAPDKEKEAIMKRLITAIAIALGLTGCVAVPYYGDPGPAAGYYYAPAPTVHFRYDYRRDYRPYRYYRHYHR